VPVGYADAGAGAVAAGAGRHEVGDPRGGPARDVSLPHAVGGGPAVGALRVLRTKPAVCRELSPAGSRVLAGDPQPRLVEAAIGPAPGEATIHLSARDDSFSLLPITARQNALFPGTEEAGTATIRVVARLADEVGAEELAAPALLKLDVQGFELQALAGCGDLLIRFAWVYAECSFVELYAGQALADEVIAWLRERGFRLSGVYHMAYDGEGRAVQADFLFGR
jgi:FkbM family methyltransferase